MDVKMWALPFIVTTITTIVLLLVRSIVFRILHSWAEKTKTHLDDIIIKSLKSPSIYWCVAIGFYIGIALSYFPEKYVFFINKVIYIIIIFSITIAVANLAGKIFKNYVHASDLPIPTTGLVYGVIKGVILVVGLLIILSVLGISITPLITALGVGGLAVALALQDTLANLFAGIHILLEKSIRVGDFIRLDTGQEGYVVDITWRTTRIKMLPNNMVVIPNSKLAQSIVTNYYLPEKKMAVPIQISVSYSSDIDKVERVLLEEAKKAINEVPGFIKDFEPVVRFSPGFGESSLDFTLICQVQEYTDQFPAQTELRKRIFKRFREEGIEIPFPQRTVHLRKS